MQIDLIFKDYYMDIYTFDIDFKDYIPYYYFYKY